MTHKLWQKKLKLKYNKDVFDIVQFGSSVIENKSPNDLDIAVVFNKISLKEQLNQSQKIKQQLSKISEIPIHIKSYDLYSLFDKSNFAKESILIYGKSLIFKDYFVKKIGFTPKIQIYYSLKNLDKKDKIKFNYLVSGKGGSYGLLKKYGGVLSNPGLIEISPEFEEIFINAIKNLISDFKIKKILISEI
jgi:predicted nucleotidyltransferase